MFLALGCDRLSEEQIELSFGISLKVLASSPGTAFLSQKANKSCTQDEMID